MKKIFLILAGIMFFCASKAFAQYGYYNPYYPSYGYYDPYYPYYYSPRYNTYDWKEDYTMKKLQEATMEGRIYFREANDLKGSYDIYHPEVPVRYVGEIFLGYPWGQGILYFFHYDLGVIAVSCNWNKGKLDGVGYIIHEGEYLKAKWQDGMFLGRVMENPVNASPTVKKVVQTSQTKKDEENFTLTFKTKNNYLFEEVEDSSELGNLLSNVFNRK